MHALVSARGVQQRLSRARAAACTESRELILSLSSRETRPGLLAWRQIELMDEVQRTSGAFVLKAYSHCALQAKPALEC